MVLYTKSIQAKPSPKDGIKICIMRRPDSWAVYDIWMPVLAPSHQLLTDAHKKVVDWDGYVERFNEEVIKGQRRFLEFLVDIAMKRDVTIVCWEETPDHCHRRLVAEECKRINPDLRIVLK